MFSIRSRHVPHPVQAPVALETASTVAAPLSIAVLTLSLVTARQIHANTRSPLLTRANLVWLGYPNFPSGGNGVIKVSATDGFDVDPTAGAARIAVTT
jgi:hypothetical protein